MRAISNSSLTVADERANIDIFAVLKRMNNSRQIFLPQCTPNETAWYGNPSRRSANREDVADCNSDYANLLSYSRNSGWSIGVTVRYPCLTYRRYYRASQLLRLPLCWLRPTILNRYVNQHPHCKRKQDWKICRWNNISAVSEKSRVGGRSIYTYITLVRHILFLFLGKHFHLSVLLIDIVLQCKYLNKFPVFSMCLFTSRSWGRGRFYV